jgi:hypothetical protein
VFSAQIYQENTFLKTKPNFSLTEKCFSLTNFSNDKQILKSLKNNFYIRKKQNLYHLNYAQKKKIFVEGKDPVKTLDGSNKLRA